MRPLLTKVIQSCIFCLTGYTCLEVGNSQFLFHLREFLHCFLIFLRSMINLARFVKVFKFLYPHIMMTKLLMLVYILIYSVLFLVRNVLKMIPYYRLTFQRNWPLGLSIPLRQQEVIQEGNINLLKLFRLTVESFIIFIVLFRISYQLHLVPFQFWLGRPSLAGQVNYNIYFISPLEKVDIRWQIATSNFCQPFFLGTCRF